MYSKERMDRMATQTISPTAGSRSDAASAARPTSEAVIGSRPAIAIEGLNKWFGDFQVLKEINLTVGKGEKIVVCGPSGSGKSTLIRCINRLEEHQQGTIMVNGVELTDNLKHIDQIRSDVGMVFQHFNLFPHLSVLENCTLAPIWVRKQSKAQAEATAMKYLERVRIVEQARKFPGQLSGGQQQRVAIARALAMEPAVVLFDEPTSALDPHLVREVATLLRALDDLRKTLIVVSHDLDFAHAVSDQVIYFEGGRAVESGTASDVFNNPQQAETRAFMESFHGGRARAKA